MHPAARGVHDLAGVPEVVEGAGVHVARLQDDDRRLATQPSLKVGDVDGAVAVGAHRLDDLRTEAQQAQSPVDGGVALRVGEHAYPGSLEKTLKLDVPALPGQHVVARRREPGGVGRLGTGHEPDRSRLRDAQQLLDPAARRLLGHPRGGGEQRVERVLIPGCGQDVGRGRGGKRATGDEPEETRPGRRHQPALGVCDQLLEHLLRRGRMSGQRPAERLSQGFHVGGRAYGPIGQAGTEAGGLVGGLTEQARKILHHLKLVPGWPADPDQFPIRGFALISRVDHQGLVP
jgi:hypothetical protein